jgi:hypothetical protein
MRMTARNEVLSKPASDTLRTKRKVQHCRLRIPGARPGQDAALSRVWIHAVHALQADHAGHTSGVVVSNGVDLDAVAVTAPAMVTEETEDTARVVSGSSEGVAVAVLSAVDAFDAEMDDMGPAAIPEIVVDGGAAAVVGTALPLVAVVFVVGAVSCGVVICISVVVKVCDAMAVVGGFAELAPIVDAAVVRISVTVCMNQPNR